MSHGSAMIPFLDLRASSKELKTEIDSAVTRVVSSGWYVGGEECDAFEAEFARYCEASYCVGAGNGLDALQLALRAMDIGPGDEVIVSSNTFIATWLAVSQVGATPVAVEPDPATHNMDPAKVEAAITPHTRALMPTHLYGQPADLAPLLEIAKQHNLLVLEDAAQAHGACYRGKRIGAHGDAVAWSFYPGKNLGAMGDGGAITTDDRELADRIRLLGNYGSREKYHHQMKGTNSRLDPIQAAVLRVKLKHLDQWNGRRRQIADLYLSMLQGVVRGLPQVPQWADPVWHLFVIEVEERSAVQQKLTEAGIQSLVHYPVPPHRQPAYADLMLKEGDFPIAERLADHVLSLPIGPHLDLDDAHRVGDTMRSIAVL